MAAPAPPWYCPAPRPPFPTYQPSQLFTQAPDVILEFLLLDPPLSLVDLAAQVPFRPWRVAIGLQQQYPQFVQAPGEEGGWGLQNSYSQPWALCSHIPATSQVPRDLPFEGDAGY